MSAFTVRHAFALLAALALAPSARAQGTSPGPGDEPAPPPAEPRAQEQAPAPQDAPAPQVRPPASRQQPASPPDRQDRAAENGTPPGQWTYTRQYGWVWLPYADEYTWVPPDGEGSPYSYVYYPSVGWTWVMAPWVWGIGPWPYFVYGPVHYGWYGRGWWRDPGRWHYRPAPPHAIAAARPWGPYRGGVYRGFSRPAPSRAFVGPRAGAGGWHGRGHR
ncbi:hypothetical protein [Anaeromyxobacter paludicola]|uniref:YXWGXW repeat-containing protein n=1 Tax=Anaeromyxobacter paludicola TaxID=2918171 RepID=A0ABM7X7Q6_9BACT|nr:hypothetical protein [Anaeromyxobacter paludicola]BDG07874.1 hypothetical protein AMPC_09870 [Anaeromyxobacter paludicola]